MKRLTVWISVMALLAGVAAPASAQQAPTPATKAPPGPAPKTAKPDAEGMKTTMGTVRSTTAGSLVAAVGRPPKEATFVVDKDTKVMKGGAAVPATALAANDVVVIVYAEAEGQQVARTVTVRTGGTGNTMAGRLKSASAEALVVLVGRTGQEETFIVDENTKITKAGTAVPATALAANDAVRVTFAEADGKRVAQTVTVRNRGASNRVAGLVKSVSTEALVVLVGRTTREETFVLDPGTRITKAGAAVPATALAANDAVRVTFAEADGKRVAQTVTVRPSRTSTEPNTQSPPTPKPKTP